MRYIVSILVVVLFVVLAIVLIATSTSHKNISNGVNLTKYNYAGTSVSQTTFGVLDGDDQRVAIEITVTQESRTIDILSGYENTISNTESYANTSQAYTAFLQALDVAGFADNRATSEPYMLGACPTGQTYQYVLNTPSGTPSSLWGTSCSAGDGTMNGEGPLIRQLFQLQISNYNTFVSNVNLGGPNI